MSGLVTGQAGFNTTWDSSGDHVEHTLEVSPRGEKARCSFTEVTEWRLSKRYVRVVTPEICECELNQKNHNYTVSIIKHLEMTLSWTALRAAKSNDKCPYERCTEKKEKDDAKSEAEVGRMQPWAEEH